MRAHPDPYTTPGIGAALHQRRQRSVPRPTRPPCSSSRASPARVVCSAHSTCRASLARHCSPASATPGPDARTEPAEPAMPAAPAAPAAFASCPAASGAAAHDDVLPGRVRRRRCACLGRRSQAVAVTSAVASACVVGDGRAPKSQDALEAWTSSQHQQFPRHPWSSCGAWAGQGGLAHLRCTSEVCQSLQHAAACQCIVKEQILSTRLSMEHWTSTCDLLTWLLSSSPGLTLQTVVEHNNGSDGLDYASRVTITYASERWDILLFSSIQLQFFQDRRFINS